MNLRWIDQNLVPITLVILIIFILIVVSGIISRKNKSKGVNK
jgi:VIT1/CCC1 family predicted Fe2+/Mn2+ transporter